MKVLVVSGDREWNNPEPVRRVLTLAKAKGFTILRHGNCRGLDRQAGRIGKELGFEVDPMDADWNGLGKKAGVLRNQAMLDKEPKPEALAAFHDDLPNSKGTADMMVRAHKADLPILHVTSEKSEWVRLREKGRPV